MRLIKLPVSQVSPKAGVLGIINDCKKIVRKYCSDRIIELKLAAKSFSFEFDFHDSRRSCTKSVDKLNTLIRRAVLKKYPFLEYSTNGYFGTTRSSRLTLDLVTEIGPINPYDKTGRSSSRNTYLISRYCRYLRYIFRKYNIPAYIQTSSDAEYDVGSYEKWSVLEERRRLQHANFPTGKLNTTVSISLGLNMSPFDQGISLKQYIEENQNETCRGGGTLATRPDYVFTDNYSSGWQFYAAGDITGSRLQLNPDRASSAAFEKIFYYLPEVVDFIAKLNRKTQYAYQAFGIEPIREPANQQ